MTPEQIKKARQEMGLTQAAMANRLGILERKWKRWEYGESPISSEGVTLINLLLEHEKLASDAERYRRLMKLDPFLVRQSGVGFALYFGVQAPDCLADLDGWLDSVLTGEVCDD